MPVRHQGLMSLRRERIDFFLRRFCSRSCWGCSNWWWREINNHLCQYQQNRQQCRQARNISKYPPRQWWQQWKRAARAKAFSLPRGWGAETSLQKLPNRIAIRRNVKIIAVTLFFHSIIFYYNYTPLSCKQPRQLLATVRIHSLPTAYALHVCPPPARWIPRILSSPNSLADCTCKSVWEHWW